MDTNSGYTAFISYSARDRVIGRRFHSALERYRIPRILRGRTSGFGRIGAGLGPIFRDRTDLASQDSLSAALLEHLKASRFLVVLCSPHAAASRWVNQEIEEFRRLGRKERIIPVLVDGKPVEHRAGSHPDGAFPPALLDGLEPGTEPFLPDLRQEHPDGFGDGFELALLKVLARILDVPLAELTQRHLEAERRKRRLTLAVACAMGLLAIGATAGGWYSWQQTRLANDRLSDTIDVAARQIETARQFRSRYGVPQAVLNELYSGAEKDFEAIVTRAGETPRLRLDRARLAVSLAEFAETVEALDTRDYYIREAEAAIGSFEEANTPWAVRLGLLEDVPEEAVRFQRLQLLHQQADASLRTRDIEAALDRSLQALGEAQAGAAAHPGPGWQRALAQARCNHAQRLYRAGRDAAALERYEGCVTGWRELDQTVGDPQDTAGLVRALSQEATVLRALDARERSLAQQKEAADRARDLAFADTVDTSLGSSLFLALLWYADALQAAGQSAAEQMTALADAEAYARKLAESDPARMDWQRNLAIVLERRATLEAQGLCAGPPEDRPAALDRADDRIREAIAIHEVRRARDPDDARTLRDLSVVLNARAVILADHAALWAEGAEPALAAAHELLARSVEIGMARVEATGEADRVALHDLAETRLKLAQLAALRQQPGEVSQAHFRRAEDALRDLLADPDAPPAWRFELAVLKARQAQDLARTNAPAAARSAMQEARQIAAGLHEAQPNNPQYKALFHQLRIFDPFKPIEDLARC